MAHSNAKLERKGSLQRSVAIHDFKEVAITSSAKDDSPVTDPSSIIKTNDPQPPKKSITTITPRIRLVHKDLHDQALLESYSKRELVTLIRAIGPHELLQWIALCAIFVSFVMSGLAVQEADSGWTGILFWIIGNLCSIPSAYFILGDLEQARIQKIIRRQKELIQKLPPITQTNMDQQQFVAVISRNDDYDIESSMMIDHKTFQELRMEQVKHLEELMSSLPTGRNPWICNLFLYLLTLGIIIASLVMIGGKDVVAWEFVMYIVGVLILNNFRNQQQQEQYIKRELLFGERWYVSLAKCFCSCYFRHKDSEIHSQSGMIALEAAAVAASASALAVASTTPENPSNANAITVSNDTATATISPAPAGSVIDGNHPVATTNVPLVSANGSIVVEETKEVTSNQTTMSAGGPTTEIITEEVPSSLASTPATIVVHDDDSDRKIGVVPIKVDAGVDQPATNTTTTLSSSDTSPSIPTILATTTTTPIPTSTALAAPSNIASNKPIVVTTATRNGVSYLRPSPLPTSIHGLRNHHQNNNAAMTALVINERTTMTEVAAAQAAGQTLTHVGPRRR